MMRRSLLALFAAFALSSAAIGEEQKIDWQAWQALPVLDDGRIKPLDTFADEKVTLIVGRSKWTDPVTGRRYKAPELLFNWVTKPDAWRGKPVIRCEYRPLRELLFQDLTARLEEASDEEIEEIAKRMLSAEQVASLKQKQAATRQDLLKLDVLKQLEVGTYIAVEDFVNWEQSQRRGTLIFHSEKVQGAFEKFQRLDAAERQREMQASRKTRVARKPPTEVETADEKALRKQAGELVRHTVGFLTLCEARNIYVVPGLDPRTLSAQFNPDEQAPPWVPLGALLRLDEWRTERDVTTTALMAESAEELDEVATRMRLYVSDKDKDELPYLPQLHQALKLQTRLRPLMEAVKPALAEAREKYDSAGTGEFERSLEIVAMKLRELGDAINDARPQMGPLVDPPKDYLPLKLDEKQIAISAYPAPKSLNTELYYNKLQPFYLACWFFGLATLPLMASWVLSGLESADPRWGRRTYLAGMAVTAAAILFATYGFALRIVIAGRPPVTNMYETVIWVSYVASVLGFSFAITPLLAPCFSWAWRLTAIPMTWEDRPLKAEEEQKLFANLLLPVGAVSLLLRAAGGLAIIYVLTMHDSSFKIMSLTPPVSADRSLSFGSLATWGVGLATVLLAAFYLPRAALTVLGALVTGYSETAREGSARLWQQVFERRLFLVCSIPVALLGLLVAYNVGNINPNVLNPRIGSIAAVLRNNYWLTIHVLTIVSSYGAGAMVWGLGNVAMLYYLFGRYRREEVSTRFLSEEHRPAGSPDGVFARVAKASRGLAPRQIGGTLAAGWQSLGRGDADLETARVRPPKDVVSLASFGYKGMQVAVLLLAVGTILGGLWADVSWGRFWDWDPKEVWALISLLVYLIFLHGRFAGWVGTFGTNAGSVLCFMAIMMSWYGVNFVLPKIHGWLNGTGMPSTVGLHAYATGDSAGLGWIAGLAFLNLVLVGLAWARYHIETLPSSSAAAASAEAVQTEVVHS